LSAPRPMGWSACDNGACDKLPVAGWDWWVCHLERGCIGAGVRPHHRGGRVLEAFVVRDRLVDTVPDIRGCVAKGHA
jgi:hypothetical protein